MTSSVGSTTGTAGTDALTAATEATAAPPRRRRGRGSALRRQERWAGWLFVLPALAILVIFLVVPIGLAFYVSLTRLGRPVQPVRRRRQVHRVRQLQEPAHGRQLDPTELRHLDPQQLLLRAVRGAAADRAGAVPGRAAEQQVPQGPQLLPDRVLLPVGHQQHRDDAGVPVPVLRRRRGQPAARLRRHPRSQLDGRLARGLPPGARVVGVDSAPGWAQHQFFNLSWWDWLSGPSRRDGRDHHRWWSGRPRARSC